VRSRKDLYLPELPERWAREHENFHFIPVLSDPAPEDSWSGRTGLVHEAILEDFPELKEHEIYACGSVRMVEAIFPFLKQHGRRRRRLLLGCLQRLGTVDGLRSSPSS
jgi:CDP-4-dehydro-6-deoxyglucose reductase